MQLHKVISVIESVKSFRGVMFFITISCSFRSFSEVLSNNNIGMDNQTNVCEKKFELSIGALVLACIHHM